MEGEERRMAGIGGWREEGKRITVGIGGWRERGWYGNVKKERTIAIAFRKETISKEVEWSGKERKEKRKEEKEKKWKEKS